MNQVANEIRKAKERAVKRDLLEQYISIKRSVMRDQLELDRLLDRQEKVKRRRDRLAERKQSCDHRLYRFETTRSRHEIETNAENESANIRLQRATEGIRRLREELEEIEAEETRIEQDSETLSSEITGLHSKICEQEDRMNALPLENIPAVIGSSLVSADRLIFRNQLKQIKDQLEENSSSYRSVEKEKQILDLTDDCAELAFLGHCDNPYREGQIKGEPGTSDRARCNLTHSWERLFYSIDPDPVMSLTRFFQCKTLILAFNRHGYKPGFLLYDHDIVAKIVPKQEQLGFAARLFGTTFFDYIYRKEHIPRDLGELKPWQGSVTPMFDELFTAVMSPTFGAVSTAKTLMRADELPSQIISISKPDIDHGNSWRSKLFATGLLKTLADSVEHTDDRRYQDEINRLLKSPSNAITDYEQRMGNSFHPGWPRRGDITADYILGILKQLYPQEYDQLKQF